MVEAKLADSQQEIEELKRNLATSEANAAAAALLSKTTGVIGQ